MRLFMCKKKDASRWTGIEAFSAEAAVREYMKQLEDVEEWPIGGEYEIEVVPPQGSIFRYRVDVDYMPVYHTHLLQDSKEVV